MPAFQQEKLLVCTLDKGIVCLYVLNSCGLVIVDVNFTFCIFHFRLSKFAFCCSSCIFLINVILFILFIYIKPLEKVLQSLVNILCNVYLHLNGLNCIPIFAKYVPKILKSFRSDTSISTYNQVSVSFWTNK